MSSKSATRTFQSVLSFLFLKFISLFILEHPIVSLKYVLTGKKLFKFYIQIFFVFKLASEVVELPFTKWMKNIVLILNSLIFLLHYFGVAMVYVIVFNLIFMLYMVECPAEHPEKFEKFRILLSERFSPRVPWINVAK